MLTHLKAPKGAFFIPPRNFLSEACLSELIQTHFQSDGCKIAVIVFIHIHGRNGSYNLHLHIILAEGVFFPSTQEWKRFQHLSLPQLRLLWQKHLLQLMEQELPECETVIDVLWTQYPDSFYAYPGNDRKSKVPNKSYRGLIRYLIKYLASPPIGLSRLVGYKGNKVKYYYKSHKTKLKIYETMEAQVFIGRMVQHILPRSFQRVRYYGLQAMTSFKKWFEVIAKAAGLSLPKYGVFFDLFAVDEG